MYPAPSECRSRFRHFHSAGVAQLFRAILVRVDDLVDVFLLKLVLSFALLEVEAVRPTSISTVKVCLTVARCLEPH